MEPNELEGQEPQKTPEDEPKSEEGGDDTPENEGDELTPEEITDLKKKASESSQNFERAKKAEDDLKKLKKEETPKPAPQEQNRLSDEDLIYLAKADIHVEDLSEVREYAEKNTKTMKEAHEYLKPILDNKEEVRISAEALNTKRSPRGTTAPKGDELLAKASKGQLPSEDDDAGINALVEAEANARKPKGE